MEVLLADEQSAPLDLPRWEAVLTRMLEFVGADARVELSVTFVDDAAIQELNREHRGLDRPTDVLSFPQLEPGEAPPPPPLPIALGDLVVSVPTARRQAEEYGHGLERELGFLLAHGLLHLLGEDHETPEQEERMRARQRALLAAVGLELGA